MKGRAAFFKCKCFRWYGGNGLRAEYAATGRLKIKAKHGILREAVVAEYKCSCGISGWSSHNDVRRRAFDCLASDPVTQEAANKLRQDPSTGRYFK